MVSAPARKDRGQTLTEFVLMLSLLTIIGLLIMKKMVGPNSTSGAIGGSVTESSKKIAAD